MLRNLILLACFVVANAASAQTYWTENCDGTSMSWDNGRGVPWCSGKFTFQKVLTPVHSGDRALMSQIDTKKGSSGIRWGMFFPGKYKVPATADYTGYVYLPQAFDSYWYMLWQTKTRSSTSDSTPTKSVNFFMDNGKMYLAIVDFVKNGKYYSSGQWKAESRKEFPVGQWVKLTVRYKWATDKTGYMVVFQDDTEVCRLDGVQTQLKNSYKGADPWIVAWNAYGEKLKPNPHKIYFDTFSASAPTN